MEKPTQPSPPARDLKERKYHYKQEPPDKQKHLQKAREYHRETWKVQPTKPNPQQKPGTQLKKKQQQQPQTPTPPKPEHKKQEKKKDNKK